MDHKEGQITLISFFRYPVNRRLWGMKQMMVMQNHLKGTDGLSFHKMLGTGGGAGYSAFPDFGTYALLTVWEDYKLAKRFESESEEMSRFKRATVEIYSIFLSNLQSRGMWSKQQPFASVEPDSGNELIVVLTRATLKPQYYLPFWKRVGAISRSHLNFPGLIFSKGIGERPWIMQATFSVWRFDRKIE